ncbi:Sec-independent protein translocase protein TatB [Azotobacter chroococcum]|uniref:Sec-independent protein translocase protein TatB n=2 Tax=Azotobacter chroococcum TaxID=353 RepID=A0A0C4WJT9_9GAMM|nr:Sec-independent protein translocase protein TatB [Azotobacter chroococcum]ABL10100.1 TatB [Azotobacter chroococcum]AJE20141.1 Sec-independent protein translocase protein TatB (Precursor) [Azotobacter chroococcum NCIMB 8003]ASL25416.1 preprotein translocase subunit TatA [Azotobacter chroococcum]MEE4464261.1 Sec-independent protein translocase protein TatB [Azotobacter chroococcum]TBW03295.1 Sec-independent protein translocase subunit TatB [Azotobacter chroococcum]
MFDIGFSELLLVGLVALLVLGPERLPVAARMAGLWIGRLKRSFNTLKTEVEREIGADEIRRQLHNERILELEREMKQSLQPPAPSAPDETAASPATPPQPASPAAHSDKTPSP